jgi:hypothetical protein
MRPAVRIALAALVIAFAPALASAQGKSKEVKAKPYATKKVRPSTDRAIVVTREVLVKHGFEVVRIMEVDGTRVVYYRRGNMGRGRGKGPVERMIIRPAPDRFIFEAAPRGVTVDINVRLGL